MPAEPLRALHWNIHSWTDDTGHRNVDTVADLINRMRPDVVSLVEVDEAGPTLPRADLAARDQALVELQTLIATLPPPWLVLGDFNTPAALWLGDSTPLASHPAQPTPTHPAGAPDEMIDYGITPRNHRVHAEVLAQPGSDHLPVLAQLDTST